MTPITHRQTIEDHVLMAHAYGNNMGAPGPLDEAEAIINERRGTLPHTSGDTSSDYSRKIREAVTVLFMRGECEDLGEYVRTARALESDWWSLFRKMP